MNHKDIIKKIKNKKLPLKKKDRKYIRKKCLSNLNFTSLNGIPHILRVDWLDSTLNLVERATKNINVNSNIWREVLEKQCERIVRYFICKYKGYFASLLIWRGSLAFINSLVNNYFKIYHIRMKRDEETLKINMQLFLSNKNKIEIQKNNYSKFIIPDPMLASGNSISYAIDLLSKLNIPASKIVILCIVSSPEGVFRLLEEYPNIRIITMSLDESLNKDAYILDGLGDCGDKYFYQNKLENFKKVRESFNNFQWKYLQSLLNLDIK